MGFQNYEDKLLGDYFKFDFGRVTVSEINRCFISSQFFYFIRNSYSSAVDFISFLFADSAADLQGCYTSEYFSTGTGFSTDF